MDAHHVQRVQSLGGARQHIHKYVQNRGYILLLLYVYHRCCTSASPRLGLYFFLFLRSAHHVNSVPYHTKHWLVLPLADGGAFFFLGAPFPRCFSLSRMLVFLPLLICSYFDETYPTMCSNRSSSASLSTTSSYGANSLTMSFTVDIFRG